MADSVEVDGVTLCDVSPRAWWLLRDGLVERGQRWWVDSEREARRLVVTEGCTVLGRDVVGSRWLVWRPLPAVPAAAAEPVEVPAVTAGDVARWFDVPADLVVQVPASGRREVRWSTCARCGESIPDWRAFGVGCPTRATYCLHHVPRRVRLAMWLRGLVRRG